jgi:hypothetical protein
MVDLEVVAVVQPILVMVARAAHLVATGVLLIPAAQLLQILLGKAVAAVVALAVLVRMLSIFLVREEMVVLVALVLRVL